jgi:hypothetical protein
VNDTNKTDHFSWRSQAFWVATIFACWLVAAYTFFIWAPWSTAIPTVEAAQRFPGQVDPTWRAVTVNHGKPQECPWGTPRENPVGFVSCTALLAASVGGFFWGTTRFHRLESARTSRSFRSAALG